jgi:predicted nucleic-acid-binding protein
MKYIDTNVLVRIITGDDQTLANKAILEIESGAQGEFCIIDAVLVELCFVLEFHTYAMARADIATAIKTLIATPQITVSDKTQTALKLYREHPKLDYADCLLFVLGGKNGVLTFDKDLQRTLLQ